MNLAMQIEDEQLEVAMETQSIAEQMTINTQAPTTTQIKNGLAGPFGQGSAKAPAIARQRVSYGRQPAVCDDPNGAKEQQVPRYGQYHSSASMQVSGPPTIADLLEAYLSSFIADRTPSTPEARAYAARHQGNLEANYSAQRSRRAADRHSSQGLQIGRQSLQMTLLAQAWLSQIGKHHWSSLAQ